jgi:hypothetical protein
MSKSLSMKLAGLAATALVAVAFSASPAGASLSAACKSSGPKFSVTPVVFGLKIAGTCFTPGGKVRVTVGPVTGTPNTSTITVHASSKGSFTDNDTYAYCDGYTNTHKGHVTVRDVKSGFHRRVSVTVPICKLA